MRAIKTLADVQIVLNQHDNFIQSFSKDVARNGLKFTGNGNATQPQDYTTLSQMQSAITTANAPSSTNPQTQHYTIVWSEDTTVITGQQLPAFIAGYQRTGLPIGAKVLAINSPSTGNLTVNIMAGLSLSSMVTILQADMIFPPGQQTVVSSSNFVNPVPYIGTNYIVFPVITNGAGAGSVTIELILQRSQNAGS